MAQDSISTKDALLAAAKKVFAAKGFDGATVKDIAEAAGVNVSLVSYHYDGKEKLFRACVEQFATTKLESAQKFLKGPESLEDMRVRLTLMAEDFFDYHLREPEINEIMHRDCGVNNPLTDDIYRTVFMKAFTVMTEFFSTAQNKGLLSNDINVEDRTILWLGGLIHMIRTEHVREKITGESLKKSEFRERVVKSAVRMAMEGSL
ncbi:MAG: TetR/AcrR family transcriptional regulator [Bdellovibrionales bacterium]|nr:TetR/AcrR family transcriptional regulator [Bdellovibrionales bacterium]